MPACTSLTAASAAAARLGVDGLRHWQATACTLPSGPASFWARPMIRSQAGPNQDWHCSAARQSSFWALSMASALDGLSVSTPIMSGGMLVAAANMEAVCRSWALCGSNEYWGNCPTSGFSPSLSFGMARMWSIMSFHVGISLSFSSRNSSGSTPRKYRGGTEYSSACISLRRKVRTALSVRLMTVRLIRLRPKGRFASGL